eukprot:Platyproteum_vivax@DN2336_c0_g1_i1.p1
MFELVTPRGQIIQTPKDVSAIVFIEAFAKYLKQGGVFEVPKWVDPIKTSPAKELAPYNNDWMYIRAASVLRRIYIRSYKGVGALKRAYGSGKRRGAAPSRHTKASGKIIRHCFQQFQKMGFVELDNEKNGGRYVTRQGEQALRNVAASLRTTVKPRREVTADADEE